jgi:hypothetical protein
MFFKIRSPTSKTATPINQKLNNEEKIKCQKN